MIYTHFEILPVLRAGGLRALDLARLGGIITFPSFHAAASILAIWGFWSVWWLRPGALMVYVGMLLATPLMGGHYFVDIIAGIGVAAIAIAAAKRLTGSNRTRRWQHDLSRFIWDLKLHSNPKWGRIPLDRFACAREDGRTRAD